LNYVIRFQAPPYSKCQSVSFPGAPGGELYCSYVTANIYSYTWFAGTCVAWSGGVVAQDESDYNGPVRYETGSYISSIWTSQCVCTSATSNARAVLCYLNQIRQTVCFRCYQKCCDLRCCWCCYQYEVYCGTPETCTYEKLYSIQETTDAECVLDGAGQINYLAVAYA
jgi:hypothetical protein